MKRLLLIKEYLIGKIVRKTTGALLFLLFAVNVCDAQSIQASVPPKGWNSWDSYGMYPTQEAMFRNLETMARKLKPYGYEYFVIDAGWNKRKDEKGKIIGMSLNDQSLYIPNKETFPGGIKAVADRAHALGLKFGIHIMRGISREAYRRNLQIGHTPYRAKDIADTTSTCNWNKDNYGVNMNKPGAQAYYDAYIAQLASWGVDFIKADDITGHPREVEAVLSAIKKTGRPILLSLSPGGDAKTAYMPVYKKAGMLRVTKDIWDDQVGIDRVFEAWRIWKNFKKGGLWLDMDMIPFGHLCLQNPVPDYKTWVRDAKKKGIHQSEHISFFTKDQMYSFMAMRALSASPLFMGGDLPTTDEFAFSLITNREMLKCNENGVTGDLIYEKDSIEVWHAASKSDKLSGWIGVFNRRAQPCPFDLRELLAGLNKQGFVLFDIWKNQSLGAINRYKAPKVNISAGGVLFCKYAIDKP